MSDVQNDRCSIPSEIIRQKALELSSEYEDSDTDRQKRARELDDRTSLTRQVKTKPSSKSLKSETTSKTMDVIKKIRDIGSRSYSPVSNQSQEEPQVTTQNQQNEDKSDKNEEILLPCL